MQISSTKLDGVWKVKLDKQEERHKELIKELLEDYNKMSEHLMEAYNNVSVMNNNLEKSLNSIKNNI